MKTIKLLLFFLLFALKVCSQNAYYEALYFDALNLNDIKYNIVQSENMKARDLYSKMSAFERKKFDEIDEKTKEILLKEKYKKTDVLEKEIIEKIKPILNGMVKKANFGNSTLKLDDFNKQLDKSILQNKSKLKEEANKKLTSNGDVPSSEVVRIINTTSDIDTDNITIISMEEFIKQDIDEANKSKINAALSDYNDSIIKQANEYFNHKTNFFTYLKQIIIIQGHQTKFSDEDYAVLKNLVDFKTDPFNNQKPDLSKLKVAFDKFNYSPAFKNAESATFFSLTNLLNPLGFLGALPNAQADTLLQGLAIYINDQVKRTHTETALGIIEKRFGRYHDFRLLFPKTYEKMVSHDWTKMQDLGNEFKQVFKEDYKNFTTNFFTLIENPKKEDWSGKQFMVFDADLRAKIYQKPYYAWSKVYLDAGKQMIDGLHPIKVLQYIDEKYKNYADSMYYQSDINIVKVKQLNNQINKLETRIEDFKARFKWNADRRATTENTLFYHKPTFFTDSIAKMEEAIKQLKIDLVSMQLAVIKTRWKNSFSISDTKKQLNFNSDIDVKFKKDITLTNIESFEFDTKLLQPKWIKDIIKTKRPIEITFIDNTDTPKDVNLSFQLLNDDVEIEYYQKTKIKLDKGQIVENISNTKESIQSQVAIAAQTVNEIIRKKVSKGGLVQLENVNKIVIPDGVSFKIAIVSDSKLEIKNAEGDILKTYSANEPSVSKVQIDNRIYEIISPPSFNKIAAMTIATNPYKTSTANEIYIYESSYKDGIFKPNSGTIVFKKDTSYRFSNGFKLNTNNTFDVSAGTIKDFIDNTEFTQSLSNTNKYTKIHNFFHTLNFIQENVRDTSSKVVDRFSKVWLNFDQLKKLEQNPQRRMYFLALLKSADSTAFINLCSHAKIDTKALFELKETKLTDGNNKLLLDNNFQAFKGKYVSPLLSVLTKSEDYLKMKEGSLYEGDNFLNYIKYFGDFIMSFDYKKEGVIDQDIHELFDNASGVINGLKTNNYANFLFDFMGILKYSFKKDAESIDKTSGDSKDVWKGYKFFNLMDEFGGFSSNIINAKTSEDVNSVLKKYVRQNNSYTISRNHRFTISFTSHPGIVYGKEQDKDSLTNKYIGSKAFATGLTMPVGLKFTWRPDFIFKYTGFGRVFGSFTFMANPIDLGSLVNYRWKSKLPSSLLGDSTTKAKASDIFTRHINTGLTVGISLKKLPINIEYVWQTSNARQGFQYKESDKTYTVLNTRQQMIRVSYDINLLNIYKTKK